jgi:hypothetical protein
MNRLQSELHRLYLPRSQDHAETDPQPAALIDPLGRVRAMVMELTRPPSWEILARVWHGVQTELDLPAPAIAVSGLDGLQLWFSIAEPIAAAQAHAFLEGLRSRFLPELEPGRIRLMPASDATALRQDLHARPVPARQQGGNWSAFVAADLAPVFADTPWLDIPPNDEGQATLLRSLDLMKQTAFEAALEKLAASTQPSHVADTVATGIDDAPTHERHERPVAAAAAGDPVRFLRQVMDDPTVALALRIEAAKVLLQHSNDHRPQQGA